MNRQFHSWVLCGTLIVLAVSIASGAGTPSLMNYQGRLTDSGGSPLNGAYSLVFTIYDDPTAGAPGNIKWQETHPSVTVTDGLFNVTLGAGTPAVSLTESVFSSPDRYLGIKVSTDPEISPRTRLVSAPYAFANNHWTFVITDNADTSLTTRGPWGLTRDGNTLCGSADSTHVNLGVASTTGQYGQNNKYCTVSGGYFNTAGGARSTVGGGEHNMVSGEHATVGGGIWNAASNIRAAVFGGQNNLANGQQATVGGGVENTASGSVTFVGGGWRNTAGDVWGATVGGGSSNSASGFAATIPGGYNDTAAGDFSFVAGRWVRLTSEAENTFAWGNNFTTSASHAAVFHDGDTPIKVGIGTTSPTTTLHVQGDALVKSSGGSVSLSGSDGSMEVWGTDGAFIDLKDSESDDYDFRITQAGTNNLGLMGGNVGIGITSPTVKLDVLGTARLRSMSVGSYTAVHVDANGELYRATSSRRYKENISTLAVDPGLVLKLEPVRFRWKGNSAEDIGLIAEDVDLVIPELVVYDTDGRPDAVKYDKITLYLLATVKEQSHAIERMKAELRGIRQEKTAEIDLLKARMTQLQTLLEAVLAGQDGLAGGHNELAVSR